MTNATLLSKKGSRVNNESVDRLLAYLFADKKAVYIDDINFSSDGGYDVSWCLEFTLKMSKPQWMDTHLERHILLGYIRSQKLNHWETFVYDDNFGNAQPHVNVYDDIETFLDENYREIIQQYMEENA